MKTYFSMALSLLGMIICVVGFYAPLGLIHGGSSTIWILVPPSIFFVALVTGMGLMYLADRLVNPHAHADWFPLQQKKLILVKK